MDYYIFLVVAVSTIQNLVCSVRGGAIFEVDLLKYQALPNKCCDGYGAIKFGPLKCNECDPYFNICLIQVQSGRKQCVKTSRENNVHSSDLVHGNIQPNHLSMNVDNWQRGILIDVDIKDFDSLSKDDDIDHLQYTYTDNPSITSRQVIVNSTKVRLTMELRVYCQRNYYGNQCNINCINTTKSYCDSNGNTVCNKEYSGVNCSHKIYTTTQKTTSHYQTSQSVKNDPSTVKPTPSSAPQTTAPKSEVTSSKTAMAINKTSMPIKPQSTILSNNNTTSHMILTTANLKNKSQSTATATPKQTTQLHSKTTSNNASFQTEKLDSTTMSTKTQSKMIHTTNEVMNTTQSKSTTASMLTQTITILNTKPVKQNSSNMPSTMKWPSKESTTHSNTDATTIMTDNYTTTILNNSHATESPVKATTSDNLEITTQSTVNETSTTPSPKVETTGHVVTNTTSIPRRPTKFIIPEPVELYSCTILIDGHRSGIREEVISVINTALPMSGKFAKRHPLTVECLSSTFEISDNGNQLTDITYVVHYNGRVLEKIEVTQVITSADVSSSLDKQLTAKNLTQYIQTPSAQHLIDDKTKSWVSVHLPFVLAVACVVSAVLLVVIVVVAKRKRSMQEVKDRFARKNEHKLSDISGSVPYDESYSIENPLYNFQTQSYSNASSKA